MSNPAKKYCEMYDAYYHPSSGEWLEDPCGGRHCAFDCLGRPANHEPDCGCTC